MRCCPYAMLSIPFCPHQFSLSLPCCSIPICPCTNLSLPICPYYFCPRIFLTQHHFVCTILSVPLCPLSFVLEPVLIQAYIQKYVRCTYITCITYVVHTYICKLKCTQCVHNLIAYRYAYVDINIYVFFMCVAFEGGLFVNFGEDRSCNIENATRSYSYLGKQPTVTRALCISFMNLSLLQTT